MYSIFSLSRFWISNFQKIQSEVLGSQHRAAAVHVSLFSGSPISLLSAVSPLYIFIDISHGIPAGHFQSKPPSIKYNKLSPRLLYIFVYIQVVSTSLIPLVLVVYLTIGCLGSLTCRILVLSTFFSFAHLLFEPWAEVLPHWSY